MIVRRLTDAGIREFENFLDSLTINNSFAAPETILTDPNMSEELPVKIEVDRQPFGSRFKLAEYLSNKLARSGIRDLEKDKGLWAWLSLYFFDELCPINSSGQRKPGDKARWIPATNDYRKYYRHLLAGPYRIYRAHRDDPSRALALLYGPLDRPGEIVEQLASRQEIVTNKAAIEAATKLYIDVVTQKPKRGAAGKGAGSARRFAEILSQFDLTWDLSTVECSELLSLLPHEFEKFRSTN